MAVLYRSKLYEHEAANLPHKWGVSWPGQSNEIYKTLCSPAGAFKQYRNMAIITAAGLGIIKVLGSPLIRLAILLAMAGGLWWFYQDYKAQAEEIRRLDRNLANIQRYDSLNYARQELGRRELEQYLEFQRGDLMEYLEEQKVRVNRIQQIITQELRYRDTVTRSQDLSPILEAIKQRRDIKVPVVDSSACLIVKGWVVFERDTLSLDITDRQFINTSDVISYWERNRWSFLGLFKTRFLGRKKATVIIKDKCGNTKTFVIDKKGKP